MKRRLLWVIDCPSPYNTHLLNAVAADAEIDLSVYFVRQGVDSHPWKQVGPQNFRWKSMTTRFVDWSFLRTTLRQDHPFLIVGGWSELTLQLCLTFGTPPFAVWTDTPRPPQRNSLREFARARWLRRIL